MSYLNELARKYPPQTEIATVRSTVQDGLAGQDLKGQMFLEVPVQNGSIPQAVLDRAKQLEIYIRDVNGKIYK